MEILVSITGFTLETSTYFFSVVETKEDFISDIKGTFLISTKLIRIESLPNTILNLNGASIGRKKLLRVTNDAIEELINSSQEMKTIGLNLLRQEIINQFRI